MEAQASAHREVITKGTFNMLTCNGFSHFLEIGASSRASLKVRGPLATA